MKKILFALVVTTFAFIGNAQVGIGTDMPNKSSQLEVVASDKGILIPQVALTNSTDQTSISNGNVESLLVYNTTASGNLTPGYYYWSNNKWNRILVGDDQPINPVTDFIDNGDGTFTYTNEEGTEYILDIPANESLSTLVDNSNGTLTYTDEDGEETLISLSTIIDNYETLSSVSIDAANGTFSFTDEDGVTHTLDIAALVTAQETLTTLVENTDGTFTYTDENGDPSILDVTNMETLTGIALNPDNSNIDYTDEDGVVTQLDMTALVDNLETVTTLVENTDGTFTYTDENGDPSILDVTNMETLTGIALNPDNTNIDYTDEDGIVTQLNLNALIDNLETVTTLVENTDGTFTYTDENGNPSILDVTNMETLTAIALNPDNTNIDYTDEDGIVTQLNLTALVDNLETVTTLVENTDGTFTYTDENGDPSILDVTNMETLTGIALNPDNTNIDYTDEDGDVTQLNLTALVDNLETVTTLVENTDGTFTYTDENGDPSILDVTNMESLTAIALNPDNTNIDYTDEDGIVTQLNLAALVKNLETNTTLTFDDTTNELTYTNEDADNPVLDLTSLKVEPWNVESSTNKATSNTQNIYQTGNVAIGKDAAYTGAALDVEGAVRGGINQQGTVGANSVAFGNGNTASGLSSMASGKDNTASGDKSVVGGGLNTASGENTVAFGYNNTASGYNSAVLGGMSNNGTGNGSVVSGGSGNTASEVYSVVSGGTGNHASGKYAVVSGGQGNLASGQNSVVSGGYRNTAFSAFEWIGGAYNTKYTAQDPINWNPADRLFNIGRGTSPVERHDALTILKNGKTGIGFDNFETTAYNEKLQVNGNARFAGLPAVAGDTNTDKVVVVDGDGVLKSIDGGSLSVSADNGLSKSGNHILLGGELKTATGIKTTATETLAIEGLQRGAFTDDVMVLDPTNGVLKKVKATMPKFFYMPPVIFDTSTKGTALTKDLFQEYRSQFETTMVSSTGANTFIPTLGAQELEYHITYYDTTVFANMSIDANGILTYDIIGGATPESFMNIVFVVK